MEEFLESCRATNLLAELEDDEELPDAEDDENEEDCDDSDEEREDNYDEEGLSSHDVRYMFGKRKQWDDEHVIKRKFSALIPAFDPRPGRTNVNQTSDLEIPAPGPDIPLVTPDSSSSYSQKLQLTVRGPTLPGVPDIEVELASHDWTIFRAVQEIAQRSSLGSKTDKTRRLWEPTYVIVYAEVKDPAVRPESESSNCSRRSSSLPQLPLTSPTSCNMDEVLQLIRQLYINTEDSSDKHSQEFLSKKITNKLVTQIQDPLVLSAASLPTWVEELSLTSPFLFPFETRQLYFHCTAFGSSRSIVWLQQQRDLEQRGRGSSGRGPEHQEFRIGRIKHERVKVPRGDHILNWGVNVMKHHADKKSVLEVEFIDEEGTGLGPTLEFFALVAAELQRTDLSMWITDDTDQEQVQNLGTGEKPPGYYILRPGGLFPAPLPQDSEMIKKVSGLFYILGVFLAKTLQDGRLVDLPLSDAFLKLLCGGEVSGSVRESSTIVTSYSPELLEDVMTSSLLSVVSEENETESRLDTAPWWSGRDTLNNN